MKGVLIGIVCAGLLFSMLNVAPPARAEAASQELSPTLLYQNDFTVYGDGRARDILANRTADADYLWDDDPGVLALTADAIDDGEFGTARIELGLQDPSGEVADYYNVRVYVRTIVFDDFLGSVSDGGLSFLDAYTWAWLGLKVSGAATADLENYWPTTTNLEYIDATGSSWYNTISLELAPNAGSISWMNPGGAYILMYHDFDENPLYERPWSLDEVNNMRVYGEFGWSPNIFDAPMTHDGTIALALSQLYVEVFPADYSAPTNPEGSFILRPDADAGVTHWLNESENDTGLWASLDETTFSSDWDTTYIHTDGYKEGYYGCRFSNPPSWAADTTYAIYPWMILQTESYTYGDGYFYWTVYPLGDAGKYTLEMLSVMNFWCNRSVALETTYATGDPWTLADLTLLMGAISIEPMYQVNVSQFAVLCVPLTDVEIEPGPDDAGGAGIFDFVVSGGGIMTIFAVIGFFGMIAVPAVAVYASREEGIGESFLSAFILMVLFLGFFLVGVLGQ
jgi:hypothetical protein